MTIPNIALRNRFKINFDISQIDDYQKEQLTAMVFEADSLETVVSKLPEILISDAELHILKKTIDIGFMIDTNAKVLKFLEILNKNVTLHIASFDHHNGSQDTIFTYSCIRSVMTKSNMKFNYSANEYLLLDTTWTFEKIILDIGDKNGNV